MPDMSCIHSLPSPGDQIWINKLVFVKSLKKKYKAEMLEKLCCVDSDLLMENLSSTLTVEAARLFATVVQNSW
jgi:hypothetical protein